MTTRRVTPKASFERINYILRPRKQIERKIIMELLSGLESPLGLDLKSYQYVGLGAIHYYDFLLVNKYLNITDMVSLDCRDCRHRFEFNIPFDFVTFENMSTSDYLQRPRCDKPRIIWFDYDSKFVKWSRRNGDYQFLPNESVLDDIRALARTARDGDVFVMTVDVEMPTSVFESPRAKKCFADEFDGYLSGQYTGRRRWTWENYPLFVQNIVMNAFRNAESFQPVKFRKLFSFVYRDGARMYTLGGVFMNRPFRQREASGGFFLKSRSKIHEIDVPVLTYREKARLDQHVEHLANNLDSMKNAPDPCGEVVKCLGFEMDVRELEHYVRYYRYYPQYYEGIV
ncbi:MAG: O-methyltransferase [Chloroflexota bacterium]|nr:O-methyltransferase [Chloroflexota bacterium]